MVVTGFYGLRSEEKLGSWGQKSPAGSMDIASESTNKSVELECLEKLTTALPVHFLHTHNVCRCSVCMAHFKLEPCIFVEMMHLW